MNIEDARDFLTQPKILQVKKFNWTPKAKEDVKEAQNTCELITPDGRVGTLIQVSHATVYPRRYNFLLSYKKMRILGLDIGDNKRHTNKRSRVIVQGNHWHVDFPHEDAEPAADTGLSHYEWLEKFCARANISLAGLKYKEPPFYAAQLGLI